MLSPRYTKVVRDLIQDPAKSLLLVAAIAIGVFGVGTILGAYAILTREMTRNYRQTMPASATIRVEEARIGSDIVDEARRVSGIRNAERHATIVGRMRIDRDWYPLLICVKDDFNAMVTNTVLPVSGAWPPPAGTMLVERTALEVMRSSPEKSVFIKTPHGREQPVTISGVVHDPGLAPARQEQTGYAYMTMATLRRLGELQGFDELRILLADESAAEKTIEHTAALVANMLQQRGFTVHEIQVPPPRRHPHQGQMNAVLSLFTVFSFITLVLGAILVTISISTLMTKQIREIGVMKTIGAGSLQISGLYFFMILAVSLVAVSIAIPASRFTAALMAGKISHLLNLTLYDGSIPFSVITIQAASGILVPLLAAAAPVLRGGRITVREAIDNYGISSSTFGRGALDALLTRLRIFGEITTLSLRNIFRQRARLVMTLVLLAFAGGMFMTAMNVSKAWDANLQTIYRHRFYDLEIRLHAAVPMEKIIRMITALPTVRAAEGWRFAPVSYSDGGRYDIARTYPDRGHGSFMMLGVPVPTAMMNLKILAGRWLDANGTREVVLNHMARAQRPDCTLGGTVTLSVDGHPSRWTIVGFVEDIGSPAVAYVHRDAFPGLSTRPAAANMLRIGMTSRDRDTVMPALRRIEEALGRANIPVAQTVPVALLRNAIAEHMAVLVGSLFAMAFLMGMVGSIGLMSTMSVNILERTREIGVMRALGATPAIISRIVIYEGLFIGIASIIFAFAVGTVVSLFLGNLLGTMAFRTKLPLSLNHLALLGWTGIVVIGSLAATIYPAWRANTLSTREALAYE